MVEYKACNCEPGFDPAAKHSLAGNISEQFSGPISQIVQIVVILAHIKETVPSFPNITSNKQIST
mgnify:CR=1 FL=1